MAQKNMHLKENGLQWWRSEVADFRFFPTLKLRTIEHKKMDISVEIFDKKKSAGNKWNT